MFVNIFKMSISRKSALISEEQLRELVRDIEEESGEDEKLLGKLRGMRKESKGLVEVRSKDLEMKVRVLEKVEQWEGDEVMGKGYEIMRKRDSVNEGRPDFVIG